MSGSQSASQSDVRVVKAGDGISAEQLLEFLHQRRNELELRSAEINRERHEVLNALAMTEELIGVMKEMGNIFETMGLAKAAKTAVIRQP